MLIHFQGTYHSSQHISRPRNTPCFSCGAEDNLTLEQQVKTYHVFFLPLFPYHVRHELTCHTCGESLSIQEMPPELKTRYGHLKPSLLSILVHFTGIFLLVALFGIIAYSTSSEKTAAKAELSQRIQTLKKGRIIEFETEEGQFSTLKICKVEGDQIFAFPNKFEVEKPADIVRIKEATFYSQDTLRMTKATLSAWLDEGRVRQIYWGSK